MGTSEIAFFSVFALLVYITSSATPDPNLGNVLSALYKQAAKSNKALVLVMDKKKNLNAPGKYADQSSYENRNDQNQAPKYNENKLKPHQHKPVYQYVNSGETQQEGNDNRPANRQHKHQHSSNHRVSYEYGYNPQDQRERYHHHEPSNNHETSASSYERPYHQEFSSYETLHNHHPLRIAKSNAPFKKIKREGVMIKSLRNLLKEKLQRSKARNKNELKQNKVARGRTEHQTDDDRDDHHHHHEEANRYDSPQYHFDKHGKLYHDNPYEHEHGHGQEHQDSREEPHHRSHDHDEHNHDRIEPHEHVEPHEHNHDHFEPYAHNHDQHQHSHVDLHQHYHEEPHQHDERHQRSHDHDEPHGHYHGHQHHHDNLRQKDRNPPAAVTTPTPDPKAKLDRHSNSYHMKKAFNSLRTEISCKSQALCKKECLGNAACEEECEQVFICYGNEGQNKMEKPLFKANSNRGGCGDDDCGNEEEEEDECTECPTKKPKCPTEDPCKKKDKCKHDKPKDSCNKCPKKEEQKGCDECSEENDECNVSTKGYGEEQDDRRKLE